MPDGRVTPPSDLFDKGDRFLFGWIFVHVAPDLSKSEGWDTAEEATLGALDELSVSDAFRDARRFESGEDGGNAEERFRHAIGGDVGAPSRSRRLSELKLGRARTYELIMGGDLPGVRVGVRQVRVRRADLIKFMQPQNGRV
jgi:excisionase family DNA binding protein